MGQRYQGIIAVQRDELCDVLSDYFEQSEQLATKFWLSTVKVRSGADVAAASEAVSARRNRAVRSMANTLCTRRYCTADELLTIDTDRLLYRLFNEWTVKRLNQRHSIRVQLLERAKLNAIRLLPEHEITELFEEQETVTMNCEMCSKHYSYSLTDVRPEEEHTLHYLAHVFFTLTLEVDINDR